MTQETENPSSASAQTRTSSLIAAFRLIGAPLMQALAETRGAAEKETQNAFDEKSYSSLIDSAIALSRELGAKIGSEDGALPDPSVRWAVAGSASQIVAANYRAAGRVMSQEEIRKLASIVTVLLRKFKGQDFGEEEKSPNTAAEFRARIMEAMVPVVGAVAQYSFGRAEHALLAEVAEQLVKIADQATRALAPSGATPEEWRLLCWNILRASGHIYADCHYAEADRLLYMNPDDRAALFAKHDNMVPMTQVWQSFRQRMAMLATLAMYLEVPESAQIEKQAWP